MIQNPSSGRRVCFKIRAQEEGYVSKSQEVHMITGNTCDYKKYILQQEIHMITGGHSCKLFKLIQYEHSSKYTRLVDRRNGIVSED